MRISGRALLYVLRPVDFDFGDAAVNAGGHVEGPGLHLALNDQRFAAGQVPDRQSDHRHQQYRHDRHGRDRSSGPGARDGAVCSCTVSSSCDG